MDKRQDRDGVGLIAEERQRQIDEEGYTDQHDDQHVAGQMAHMAIAYCITSYKYRLQWVPVGWDIKPRFPSPGSRIRDLVKAGALIAAEIDRLQRLEAKDG